MDGRSTPGASSEVPEIFGAARAGDALALEVVDEEARRIALDIAPVAAVIDVELIVIGGGIVPTATSCSHRSVPVSMSSPLPTPRRGLQPPRRRRAQRRAGCGQGRGARRASRTAPAPDPRPQQHAERVSRQDPDPDGHRRAHRHRAGRAYSSAGEYIAEIQRRLAAQDKLRDELHAMGTDLEGSTEDSPVIVAERDQSPLKWDCLASTLC